MSQHHAVIEAMSFRHSLVWPALAADGMFAILHPHLWLIAWLSRPGSSKRPLPDRMHIFFDTHYTIKAAVPGFRPLSSQRTVRCRSAIRDPGQALQPIALLCQ